MPKPYFVNPPKKKGAKRRTPKRGKDGKFLKSVRTKSGKKVSRAAWRRSGYRRNPTMAKRKRRLPPRTKSGRFRKRGTSRNPSRRRSYALAPRRRRRRNPPMLRGIVGEAMNVAIGGAGVTAGKIVNRQGVSLLKLDADSPVGIAAQLGIALAAGMGAKRFLRLRGPFVDGLVYGAASAAFESGLRLIAPDMAARLLDGGAVAVPVEGWPYDGAGLSAYATPGALPAPSRDQSMLMGAYSTGVY